MDPTTDNFIAQAAKIKVTLTALHAAYPDSLEVDLLHRQLNTGALMLEQHLSLTTGQLGGSAGTFHPDSGGTGKGDAS